MKVGDRVTVIAAADEYNGFSGEIVDLTPDGQLIVDIEVPRTYRVPFDPHAVELERIVRRKQARG